jgi:glycosyltransferase involved in cell wall biosynthesis
MPDRSAMKRPIAYDTTHLVSRLCSSAVSGIERVDLAYGRYFAASPRMACGVHYGLFKPHTMSPLRVKEIVHLLDRRSCDLAAHCEDDRWARLRAWLIRQELAGLDTRCDQRGKGLSLGPFDAFVAQCRLRVTHDRTRSIPEAAIYLNVAQAGLEYPIFFNWLDHRPNVLAVFFIHDLLPLEYPEYFPRGNEARFARRLATVLHRAHAIITTSQDVAERIEAKFSSLGRSTIPIHVQPLASPLEADRADVDAELANSNYYVMVSTIEPRKNHILLLNVWRSLVADGGSVPKLVVVGAPGWENERTFEILARSDAIRPHVRAVADLSRSALSSLIQHARALLMPSFAEGYGLPLVEALSLGTPVIASDIPVFREVTRGRATFRSPIDGVSWRDAVRDFSDNKSGAYEKAAASIRGFVAPDWKGYFAGVEGFLNTL